MPGPRIEPRMMAGQADVLRSNHYATAPTLVKRFLTSLFFEVQFYCCVSATMPCGDVDLNERLDAFIRDLKQG